MRKLLLLVLLTTLLPAIGRGQQVPPMRGDSVVTTVPEPTMQSLAQRASDVINVRDYGARGDGQMAMIAATILAGSTTLKVGKPTFAATDVGKAIGIANAGAAPTTGRIVAIPVASAGSDYQGLPAIAFDSAPSPTTAASPAILMGIVSATVTSAGSGCTNGTQTVKLNMKRQSMAPSLSVIVSEGMVTAVSSVRNSGLWNNDYPSANGSPALTNISSVGAACSVSPRFTVSMGVVGIGFGRSYWGTGYGDGYPLKGVKATLSGGSPGTAAKLGTPVVAATIPPLLTIIAAYVSPTQVILRAPAATELAGASTGITWGTLDTAAIQAAVDAGPSIFVPPSPGCYLTDLVTLPSGRTVWGRGASLCLAPGSLNPMFQAAVSAVDIEIQGLTLVGNRSTQLSRASGSSGVSAISGQARISVNQTRIRDFTRHGLSFDGVTGLRVVNNEITGSYYGGGVLLSSRTPSQDAIVIGNTMSDLQLAGVNGYVGIDGGLISSNLVIGSNLGFGDSTSGNVSDCITGYSANSDNRRTIISGNYLRDCGNNGMHWGGDHLTISNNVIVNPLLYCLIVGRSPNSAPTTMVGLVVTGNQCQGATRSVTNRSGGYSIRQVLGGTITGNTADMVYTGIELFGFNNSGGSGVRNMIVSGNNISNAHYCIWLRNKIQDSRVEGNLCSTTQEGVQVGNDYADGFGRFPSLNNYIGPNTFDRLIGSAINEVSGNFNVFEPQHVLNSTGGAIVISGDATLAKPSKGSHPVDALPSAGTYKQQCISVSGSITGNIMACSDGKNWRWVRDNMVVSSEQHHWVPH